MDVGTPRRDHTDMARRRATLSLAALATSVFLTFMTVGMPLPVIPLYVGHELAFGNVLVGLSVGIQFLATILTRGVAGREADHSGARPVMLRGMLFCACSGVALILSARLPVPAGWRLLILIAGRLVLGFGESQLIVGMFGWGIGTVGQPRSGTVLAWTGMAMYGAIAAAAPLGFWLYHLGGLTLVGAAVIVLPAVAAVFAFPVAGVAPHAGERHSFWRVIGLIWQPGLGVLFQGVGFAGIGAFISLDFASHGWSGAGVALTCFGAAFVLVRILFGKLPDRVGGTPVAIVSLIVEAAGQGLLFVAPVAWVALLGSALTGAGCSLVFPSLGVEVVKRVTPQIRASALGGLLAFQDIAYGLTGPVTGALATGFGYSSVYAVGALCALGGLLMTMTLATGAFGWSARQ
ncbi:MFS transporter [Paraburkholderia sp. USG1]|uniref:MFS transporter n=1 Tax=Paraburkholderia sp. USG1 TaxID=2952268 RepID=UPI002856B68F|nr:MFS transporter [Paraburkholderia sp. USG1]MDR8398318.1 MFS transporter [Paraburkholderia sp. USG1]